jgi:hypothetical protein
MSLFTAVAFATLYFGWGKQEYGSGTIMAAISGGVSGLVLLMGHKFAAIFAAQVLLGVLFLGYHFTRPSKKHF